MATITPAFGLTTPFERRWRPCRQASPALHYVLLDKKDNNQDVWSKDHRVFVAVGSLGGPDSLERWAQGDADRVQLLRAVHPHEGAAGRSALRRPAGDQRLGELLRGLDQRRTTRTCWWSAGMRRWRTCTSRSSRGCSRTSTRGGGPRSCRKATASGGTPPDPSFLAEDDTWQRPYFTAGNPKSLQRTLYSSGVQGNV